MALLIFLFLMLVVGFALVAKTMLDEAEPHLIYEYDDGDWVIYKNGVEIQRIKYYQE